jgi:hypothetical protein
VADQLSTHLESGPRSLLVLTLPASSGNIETELTADRRLAPSG